MNRMCSWNVSEALREAEQMKESDHKGVWKMKKYLKNEIAKSAEKHYRNQEKIQLSAEFTSLHDRSTTISEVT